jgi:hypothetical protein
MFDKLVGLTAAHDIKSNTDLEKDSNENLRSKTLLRRGQKISREIVRAFLHHRVDEVPVRVTPLPPVERQRRTIKRRVGKKRFLRLVR